MLIDELNYTLPPELIAQTPADRRDRSRLLVAHRKSGEITECHFENIGDFLKEGDLLVLNNAQVIKARLFGRKETGGKVEILLLEDLGDCCWEAMLKPAKRVKNGTRLYFSREGDGPLTNLDIPGLLIDEKFHDGKARVRFDTPQAVWEIMDLYGELPLPPYIKNFDSTSEGHRYQTVYASQPGAVAAPTAGLHMTPELMGTLKSKGIDFVEVTLNVGAGTFLPLKSDVIEDNALHSERFSVTSQAAAIIKNAIAEGRRIIPVGTTSMRVLESLGPQGFDRETVMADTDIFIYPGKKIHVASGMITNFHLPGTSLLCLVAALAGVDLMKRAYSYAVENKFRFYSFGDSMLIID